MNKKLFNNYILVVLVLFFSVIYSFYSISSHLRFKTFAYDLGIYDQIIWLASRFKAPYSSILGYFAWGDHFTPTFLLLAPLYWLWDNVMMLLLFQAFFLSLGAVPIYLLSVKKIKNRLISFSLSFAYLLFFGFQNAMAFDFHPLTLAPTFLAFLFYFYEEKKWWLFWLFFLLMLGLQENLALLSIGLGVFLLLQYRDWKKGAGVSFLGLSWFLFVVFFIAPYFRQGQFLYMPNMKDMEILGIFKSLVEPAIKRETIFYSLLSFGFLPLLSPSTWPMLFEEFFQRFVGSTSQTRWGLGYHYNAILAPILAVGAILTIEKYLKNKKMIVISALFSGLFLVQIFTNPSLNHLQKAEFYQWNQNKNLESILKLIPPSSSVAATNNLVPHLSHREQIILLTNCLEDKTVWKGDMKRCFDLKPDFLVADLNPQGSLNNYYPDYSREVILNYFEELQKRREYQLVRHEEEIYLLEKIY